MSNTAENRQPEPASPTPGANLAQARIEQSITLEDVAAKLYLSVAQIIALENDDAEPFGSASYVRGYQRTYAKFLNIPAPETTAADTKQTDSDQCDTTAGLVIPNSIGVYDQTTHKNIRRIGYAVLIVLIISIATWSLLNVFDSPESNDTTADIEIIELQGPPSPTPLDPTADVQAIVTPESNDQIDTVPTEPLVETSLPARPEITFLPSNDLTNIDDSTTQNSAAAIATPIVSSDAVVLTYSEDSWTEVHDNTGKQLIYDLVRAGTVKQIEGTAPFEVFLGNSRAVTIVYNSAPFDHPQSKTVTRFKITD